MRNIRVLLMAVVAGAPCTAAAQNAAPQGTSQPPQQVAGVAPADTPWTGRFDFGVRGTDLDGDAARYERYRDLDDGLFLESVRVNREFSGWRFDFAGDHVGRRDQRYAAAAVRPGRISASFMWDQIPMLLSRTTRSLFTGIGAGELRIDNAIQTLVEANRLNLAPLFEGFARDFDTRTRRHIANGRFEYLANEELAFRANFRRIDREGTIPYGGSFGHSSLVELPAPTEHTLSDFDAGAEFVRQPWLLRAGYTGSWFHNDVTSVIFDNPFRVADIRTASSAGRLSLAPSSSQFAVNGLASVKLPYRSRATAYVSAGMLQDAGVPLIPQTINAANTPASLERSTVDGEARTTAVHLSFVSRPNRYVDVNVRYRSYDFDNQTPVFTLTQRISYDNAPSTLAEPVHTEPYSLLRHTLDADFRWIPWGTTSAGIGYTRLAEDRTHRIFESTTDDQIRLTFDTMTQRWFTVRAKYEHARRRGEGIEQGIEFLREIGEQPGMRHFDIASRDRDRFTLIGSITPAQNLTANVSVGVGKDDYIESEFGLRDNTHRVYSAGADFLATDRVSLGVSYSFEDYDALSRSRQANPGEQDDPARNWAADTSDRTHSVLLNADVSRIADKVDLRFTYDFSRGRAIYDYITGAVPNRTLPEEVIVPTALPPPTELPPTLSELQRGTVDATYALTTRLSVGASYWYERFRVRDWTLDIDANPELVRDQVLLMGYLYRPYTANTFWLRLIYGW
jgi:MtrB/PioB family decaheme-associated outer membrane protein